MSIFDKSRTQKQLVAFHGHGLKQTEAYWNFGYPMLSAAFPSLTSGLFFIAAPENVGKSIVQVNLGYQVLLHTPNSYWLDFSLDDSIETRYSYLLARHGGISINLSRQVADSTPEQVLQRKEAFTSYNTEFGDRYSLRGVSELLEDEEDDVYRIERAVTMVRQARQELGPEAKLFVTVDGFHDFDVGAGEDENSRLARKSQILKRSAPRDNALYLLTAHMRKDSRRRELTSDALKGEGKVLYDARITTLLYNDVDVNEEGADVYWLNDEEPDRLMPVVELQVKKNKVGNFKKTLFYNLLPERALLTEADEESTTYYRSVIYGLKKKDKK